jgi:predicted site-specific integrase-resolvase|tara:strand:+ start:48 stop:236 length:189 start_codon:yes stop_codon:yes gene_type:complete
MQPLMTYIELGDKLQVSQRTLKDWVSKGVIPHKKIGASRNSTVRFVWADVEKAITPAADGTE